jgi:hypothetical protein
MGAFFILAKKNNIKQVRIAPKNPKFWSSEINLQNNQNSGSNIYKIITTYSEEFEIFLWCGIDKNNIFMKWIRIFI